MTLNDFPDHKSPTGWMGASASVGMV